MPETPHSSGRWPASLLGTATDEREFEAFAQAQDPLDIEAATWVARRRNGLGAQGEAELQAWLVADPRHVAAFEDMDDTFGGVRQLPDDDVASLKAGLNDGERLAVLPSQPAAPTAARASGRRPAQTASPGRRPWLRGMRQRFS